MSDSTIVVFLPDGRALGLDPQVYADALERGAKVCPGAGQALAMPPQAEERVLDAEGMAELTRVPATWWLEQARQGGVPHLRAGKYVRFRVEEALEALSARRRPGGYETK